MNNYRQRFIRLRDYAREYTGNSRVELRARRMAAANAWSLMDARDRKRFSYDAI